MCNCPEPQYKQGTFTPVKAVIAGHRRVSPLAPDAACEEFLVKSGDQAQGLTS